MTPNDVGKDKRKVKNLIDHYNNQGKPAVVNLESQHKKVSSSPVGNNAPEDSNSNTEQQAVPKGNKIRLGLKIANGIAALVAFSLAIASVGTKLLRGDLTGLMSIVKATALITFRASNVVLPITTLKDKFIKKLESSKVGKVLSNTVGTIWKTLTSKPVKRSYSIGMSALTILSTPTPLGVASAVISLTAISYNVIKENLRVRDANRLMQEHNLLKQHVKHKQKQSELIKILESSKLPDLQSFAKVYKTSLGPKRDTHEVIATVKTSKVVEILRAMRDNTLETFVAIGKSLSGDPVDQAMAAFVTLGNVTGEANKNLQNRKDRFALQKANDKLQMEIVPYKTLEELITLERQEKIKTEALTRLVKEVQNGGLKQLPEERFAALCAEVEQEKAFAVSPKDSLFTEMTSGVTPGSGYVEKSPSDNISNVHTPKQTERNVEFQQKQAVLKSHITKTAKRDVELAQLLSDKDKPKPHKDSPKTPVINQIKPSVTPSSALPYSKELGSKIRSR